ncbi:hypothetical protein AAMO2058_000742000 [Amorphochlora amoebiformis]
MEPAIRWRRQTPRADVGWLIAFLLCLCIWALSCIWILGSINVDSSLDPKGSLAEEIKECHTTTGFGRQAGSIIASMAGRAKIWTIFSSHIEVLVGAMMAVTVLSFFWLLILQLSAYLTVWVTMFIKTAALIAIGFRFNRYGFSQAAHAAWLTGFGLGIVTIWQFRRINLSAKILEKVGASLREGPATTWLAVCALQLILLVSFMVFSIVGACCSFYVWEIRRTSSGLCVLQRSTVAQNLTAITALMFAWVAATLRAARLVVVAAPTICWYYPRLGNDAPKSPALVALGWSMTTSAGTLTLGGFLNAIAAKAEEAAFAPRRGCCGMHCGGCCACCTCELLNPIGVLFNLMWYLMESCAVTATRFALTCHVFTGKDFWTSALMAYRTLGGRGAVGGYIVSQATESVVTMGAYVFAVMIGLGVWDYTDFVEGYSTLQHASSTISRELLFYLLFGAYLLLTYYPILTLIVVTVISDLLPDVLTPFLCGLFISCSAHLIFGFLGGVIVAASNTIYFCYCLDLHAPAPISIPRVRPIPSAPSKHVALHTLYGELEAVHGPLPMPSAPPPDLDEDEDDWPAWRGVAGALPPNSVNRYRLTSVLQESEELAGERKNYRTF